MEDYGFKPYMILCECGEWHDESFECPKTARAQEKREPKELSRMEYEFQRREHLADED